MRNLLTVGIILALMLIGISAALADTTTGTCAAYTAERDGYSIATFDWLSNADGGVLGSTPPVSITGEIVRVSFLPDSATATSPTANYDVSILDSYGVDVLLGAGANRSQSAAQSVIYGAAQGAFGPTSLTQTVNTNNVFLPWRMPVAGEITFKVENAGANKGGRVRLQCKVD